jgi:acyl-CoA reductase-like NAD-dependent aldehyde dehydrogenase
MSPSLDDATYYHNYVGGKVVPSGGSERFVSVNPTTGEEWGTFGVSTPKDVDHAVNSAHSAFKGPWSKLSATRRGRLLMRWADKLSQNADKIAHIETSQNGKLYAEMRAQVFFAGDFLYYYGGLADKIEGSVIPVDRTSVLNYTIKEPLGVVAVIVPWNSPTLLTLMGVAPALAAGNTVVIKPSEFTAASSFELVRLAEEAGIMSGVINIITGGGQTGEALVDHPLVSKITFTGSDGAGRKIASRAGARLASSVLELGGKSPNIVFSDSNLDQAEAGVLAGIFAAAGQTCVAGSRAYVQRPVYQELADRLVSRARAIVLGDPMLPTTQMGPIATLAQLKRNEAIVQDSIKRGSEILYGGERAFLDDFPKGLFYKPTILHNLSEDNPILSQEVFGPVLALIPFESEEEVISLANASPFGLAAGIWTNDLKRAHRMARSLEAGTVWINTYRNLTFNSPFGGYKSSGIGRQNGIEGIHEYLQTKSVWCELSNDIQDPFVIKT